MQPKIIVLAFIILVCSWSCSEKGDSSSEPVRVSKRNVGIAASTAAEAVVEAMRECRIAAISDLNACANNEGILLPEVTGRMLAVHAKKKSQKFADSCLQVLSREECTRLLARAIEMEMRRPPSNESEVNADDR